ncbi:MAG: glycosyltransferase family 2 protein [Bacteroidaceae bacterium]|nr:glycosyltransferase family 2 protein [Bacteroidaceae bacterium]
MNKVSIIIPIYNVERYLKRALDSVLAQTYQNWEAIMVDDGSTDSSGEIAEQYCRKDKRFTLVKQENQGQGVARNNALKLIKGDYVMYLDPDDMYHPQAMEICVNASLRDGTDMVTYTYNHTYRTLNKWLHKLGLGDLHPKYKHYTKYDYFVTENIFEHATECNQPIGVNKAWKVKHCQSWRCMLKADLARKATFTPGVNYQDVPWWAEILLNVKKTTIIKLPLYYYYPNPCSFVMSAKLDRHIHSLEVIINETDKLFENASPNQRKAWNLNFRKSFQCYLEKKKHKKKRCARCL